MNRQDHIHAAPNVKGTRLTADFLLGLVEEGWTEAQILEKHPQIRPQTVRSAFDFANAIAWEETLRAVRQLGDCWGRSIPASAAAKPRYSLIDKNPEKIDRRKHGFGGSESW